MRGSPDGESLRYYREPTSSKEARYRLNGSQTKALDYIM
jgi:hypothetical protein